MSLMNCERLLRGRRKRRRCDAVASSSQPPSLDDELDSGCGGTYADLAHFNETSHVRADTCLAAIVNRDAAKAQVSGDDSN
jgi:hypothetical protein